MAHAERPALRVRGRTDPGSAADGRRGGPTNLARPAGLEPATPGLEGCVLQDRRAGAHRRPVIVHHAAHLDHEHARGIFGIGAIVGPALLTQLLINGLSWTWLYLLAGALYVGLIVVASLVRYPETTSVAPSGGGFDGTARAMKNPYILAFSTGASAAAVPEVRVALPERLRQEHLREEHLRDEQQDEARHRPLEELRLRIPSSYTKPAKRT